jgi:hypothetical protein
MAAFDPKWTFRESTFDLSGSREMLKLCSFVVVEGRHANPSLLPCFPLRYAALTAPQALRPEGLR